MIWGRGVIVWGFVLVVALFLASAQAFNAATPDAGLPRVVFSVFLLVLLLNTLAASPDRVHVLRSLMVVFGSAFVIKYIVLATDGQPTCKGGDPLTGAGGDPDSDDLPSGPAAVAEVAAMGIKVPVVGTDDPRVVAARRRLTNLLY